MLDKAFLETKQTMGFFLGGLFFFLKKNILLAGHNVNKRVGILEKHQPVL